MKQKRKIGYSYIEYVAERSRPSNQKPKPFLLFWYKCPRCGKKLSVEEASVIGPGATFQGRLYTCGCGYEWATTRMYY